MLIQCFECKGQVSSLASHCPHCGAPVNSATCTQPHIPSAMGLGRAVKTYFADTTRFRNSRTDISAFPDLETNTLLQQLQSLCCRFTSTVGGSPLERINQIKHFYAEFKGIREKSRSRQLAWQVVQEEILCCLWPHLQPLSDFDSCIEHLKHVMDVLSYSDPRGVSSPVCYKSEFKPYYDEVQNAYRDFIKRNIPRGGDVFKTCWCCKSRPASAEDAFHVPMSGEYISALDAKVSLDDLFTYPRERDPCTGTWVLVDIAVPRCASCAQHYRDEMERLKRRIQNVASEFELLEKKSFVFRKQDKLKELQDEFYKLRAAERDLPLSQFSHFPIICEYEKIDYNIGERFRLPRMVGKTPSDWTPDKDFAKGKPREVVRIGV